MSVETPQQAVVFNASDVWADWYGHLVLHWVISWT